MEFKPEKQYVSKLLGEEGRKFIIPEYQRPYRWGKDECETLWNDILGVFNDGENIEEYFLGSIVAFESEKSELEIIDGQQRITTLTLFFRAFYECFSKDSAKEKKRYLESFGKCVWEFDLDKGLEFDKSHLSSKVIADRDEEIFKKLLSEKLPDEIKDNSSNYAKNYNFFYEKLQEFKSEKTLLWEKLGKMFLEKNLFVLLVVCDSQESAMTIFNTLNSRGLPLSNADILKGYIYKKKNSKEKEKFANDWKEIESKVEDSENIKDFDFLFLQYMHIIRAENEDTNTTTQGILPFFTKKDKKEHYGALQDWLYRPDTIPFIANLADFWINPKEYLSDKSGRYIDILNLFQNDTWKIFVSYLVWRNKNCFKSNKNEFSKEFDEFLPELIKFITLPFLNNNSTTGVIKEIVFKMNVSLYQQKNFAIALSMPKKQVFFEIINSFDKRKIKYILYLYAYIYNNFKEDINPKNKKLEVEHILPKQWQNANFDGWNEKTHKEYLEKIGNKILLDKQSNIKCKDGFFAQKQKIYKEIYEKASLKEVCDLGTKEHTVLKQKEKNKQKIWEQKDIDNRGEEIYKNLKSFLSNNN